MVKSWREHLEPAVRHLAGVEAEQVLSLPDFQPRVLIEPKDAFQVDLIARFPVPTASRAFVAQAVLRGFYADVTETGAPKSERPPVAAVPRSLDPSLPPALRQAGGGR